MSKEWDKIQAQYKKLQPRIKKVQPTLSDKMIKQVKAALATAWDAEDAFKAALKEAQASGLKGKKPSDYAEHQGFKKTHAELKKKAAQHDSEIKALEVYCKGIGGLGKEMIALQKDITKSMDKKDGAHKKFQAAFQKETEMVMKVANARGTLTAPEVLYGSNFTRVVDNVIKKQSQKGKRAGDAAKLIEVKELTKNLKIAGDQKRKVFIASNDAMDVGEDDPKATLPHLKKMSELVKELKSLDEDYQQVLKKNKDMISKSKDKARIIKVIAAIAKECQGAVKRYTATVKLIGKWHPDFGKGSLKVAKIKR